YSSSNISFMDDVLDVLCVPEHSRIVKPGKVSENDFMAYLMKCREHRSDLFRELSDDDKGRIIGNNRKQSAYMIKKTKSKINREESKYNIKILNRERNQKH